MMPKIYIIMKGHYFSLGVVCHVLFLIVVDAGDTDRKPNNMLSGVV